MTLLFAMATSIASGLPIFLFSALFVEISRTTGAPISALGAVVAVYWVSAFVVSPAAGRLSHAMGSQRLAVLSVALAVVSLLGSALLVQTWQAFLVWSAFGGASNALGHPASNHLIGLRVRFHRLALAYGVKQAAVPLTTLAAGLAVPVLALTIGWRWAFVAAAALGTVFVALFVACGTPRPDRGSAGPRRRLRLGRARGVYFFVLACVSILAAGASMTTVSFAVTAGVHRGLEPGLAGVLLGVASLIGALARVGAGAFADRRGIDPLRAMAAMQALGAVGILAMAWQTRWSFTLGLLVALGLGWGWPGLLNYVVSRTAGPATAAATGVVSVGNYAGNAVTPLVLGLSYDPLNDAATWVLAGTMLAVAAGVTWWLSRRATPPPVTDQVVATH